MEGLVFTEFLEFIESRMGAQLSDGRALVPAHNRAA